MINRDPTVRDLLKVVFLPNYNVSLAELIIPAADLSEQISTAGMEASGTGNMKLALNGALTIGTLDGANVEIREQVGDGQHLHLRPDGRGGAPSGRRSGFDSSAAIEASPALAAGRCDAIASGVFSPDEPEPLRADRRCAAAARLVHGRGGFRRLLRHPAPVDASWRDGAAWWRRAIRNTARMGWFSSDRTIREYAERHLERSGPAIGGVTKHLRSAVSARGTRRFAAAPD